MAVAVKYPVICLEFWSPKTSSNLPFLTTEVFTEQMKSQDIHGLAAREVYQAPTYYYEAGGLLHHLFTLISQLTDGIFSAALSVILSNSYLLSSTLLYAVRTFLYTEVQRQGDPFLLQVSTIILI